MAEPYYHNGSVTIYCGDTLNILKDLPDKYINCCVTSPPYWGMRDYGDSNIQIWGEDKNCTHLWGEKIVTNERGQTGEGNTGNHSREIPEQGKEQKHGSFCQKCGAWRGQLGLEPTPELYVKHIAGIFSEIKRVLKDDGTLWLNLGDSYNGNSPDRSGNSGYNDGRENRDKRFGAGGAPNLKQKDLVGIPWRVAFALQKDDWYLRNDIIWRKLNPMPESVTDRCTKSHEYIFLLSKSKHYYYDIDIIREPHKTNASQKTRNKSKEPYNKSYPGGHFSEGYRPEGHPKGKNKRDVWEVNTKPFPEAHFAVYPEELIEPCIKAGCPEGGIVLDPFMGSGTTNLVATKQNKNSIGIDLSEKYINIAINKRIEPYKTGLSPTEQKTGQMTLFEGPDE